MEKKVYTSREVNRNFKIKVYGVLDGVRLNTLLGFSGYLALLGDNALAFRLLDRAFHSMADVCHCKLRRGIKVSFYAF